MPLATNYVNGIGMIYGADEINEAHGAVNDNTVVAALLASADVAVVATAETTTSASFTDLTTTTDEVTVDIGASGRALVLIYARIRQPTGNHGGVMSYAASGANTIAADDSRAAGFRNQASVSDFAYPQFAMFLHDDLDAGSTTFKLKYKATSGGTASEFSHRRITVIPVP